MKNILNWQIGENKVTFAQTSKGNWYCSELSAYPKDLIDGLCLMDAIMTFAEEICERHNTKLMRITKDKEKEE